MDHTSKQYISLKQQGFTLLEIVIVVGIIAVLVAIAVPQFGMYRQKAQNNAALSDMRTFKIMMELYFQEHSEFPVF